MRGHIYCSEKCSRDAGRHAVWRRVRGVLSTPVPARIAVVAVVLAAAAPVVLALRTVRELDGLNASSPLARPRREAPTARLDSVEETASGLRLAGASSSGGAVFLFSGSRFLGAAPVENGRFVFEGVRDRGPFRVGAMPLSSPISYARPGSDGGPGCPRGARRPHAAARRDGPDPGLAPVPGAALRRDPAGAARFGRSPRAGVRAGLDARALRPARHRRLLRRRLLRPRRVGHPRRPRRARNPHDDLSVGRVHPPIPRPRAAHRRGRPRSRKPHRHAPPSDDLRRRRASDDAARRRPRLPRRRALPHGAPLSRRDRTDDGADLARAVRRAQRGDPPLGRRGRLLARRMDGRTVRSRRPRLGQRSRARARISRPTGCSPASSPTPRTAGSSSCTSAATGRNPWPRASEPSSTA